MTKKIVILPNLTLFVALALSTVAEYYSIMGLMAIFPGATIPIIVMGIVLGVAKLTATVWVKAYWDKCGLIMKTYLIPSIVILMMITSMGIFGFLSKSHLDQGVPTGDIAAKVAVFDEKIKTSKENIDSNRKILKQMDESVDQVLGRSTDSQGADKAVAVRKSQQKERARLQAEITTEQKTIAGLNEQRAPLASEFRKVEAEVGPLKYIAALIYGDNPDQNLLEKAVRWVIILIVIVFDPLAVALLLASNQSREWEREVIQPTEEVIEPKVIDSVDDPVIEYEEDNGPLTTEQIEQIVESAPQPIQSTSYTAGTYTTTPITMKYSMPTFVPDVEDTVTEVAIAPPDVKIITDGVTTEHKEPPMEYLDLDGGYVSYQGKHMNKNVLKDMRPDLFRLPAKIVKSAFGGKFPTTAERGDVFVRIDAMPNRVYKFDGSSWMAIDKEKTDTYLYDVEYIKYLVSKIETGEYDIDLVTEHEKEQIEEYLSQK